MITVAVALACAGVLVSTTEGEPKPKLNKEPLSAERIAVYSAFLKSYSHGGPGTLNLGNRTVPLEISKDDLGGCLSGINLEPLGRVVHVIGPEVIKGRNIRLVDPEKQRSLVQENDPSRTIRKGKPVEDAVGTAFASGLLSVSEIAFDMNHKFAVFKFSFYCGGLCGHGGTLVFEKVGDEWRPSEQKSPCSRWIS